MTSPPRPTPARLLAIALGTAADPDPADGERESGREEPPEAPRDAD
jgi:hypothetical protein